MDKIPKVDFVNLLRMGIQNFSEEVNINENTEDYIKTIESGNYYVEDKVGQSKQRIGQQVFSNTVKSLYDHKCSVCGIGTKQFLVGSHIIPWSSNKETRLDPRNGICLCSFHDKAFDEGFFTINEDYKIEVSNNIQDKVLASELSKINNQKIAYPRAHKPMIKYLKYHNEYIFNKWKIQSL